MKNITTPRTLAECTFTLGYSQAAHPAHRESPSLTERIYGVVLATVLGIVGAAALLHWWST